MSKKNKKMSPKKIPKNTKAEKTKKSPLELGEFSSSDPSSILTFLETSWPIEMTDEIKAAFNAMKYRINGKIEKGASNNIPVGKKVDILKLIKDILPKHDMLFLSRSIRYHVAANTELPLIDVDQETLKLAISELLSHIARRSPYGGRVSLIASEIALRGSIGIELQFHSDDELINDESFCAFVSELYGNNETSSEIASLISARQLILKLGGQLWVDKLETGRIAYRIILHSERGVASITDEPKGMAYRFDVTIVNFNMVRKYYGIKKSQSLVKQIEKFLKTLVRDPIDTVVSVEEKGMLSVIYEASSGLASSVSSRISKRLSTEQFRVGRKPVELKYHYVLTPLFENKK